MSNNEKLIQRRQFLKTAGAASLVSASNKGLAVNTSNTATQTATPAMYLAASRKAQPSKLTQAPPLGVIAWNHMAFGPTPNSMDDFNARGATDQERLLSFVDEQLTPQSIDDSVVDNLLSSPAYRTLQKSLTQLWADHYRAPNIDWSERIRPVMETLFATMTRAIHSKRQLQEVLVHRLP